MATAEQEARAVVNKCLQRDAISEIVRTWGASDHNKLDAIRIVLTGKVPPIKVVGAVDAIANALGSLEALMHESGLIKPA